MSAIGLLATCPSTLSGAPARYSICAEVRVDGSEQAFSTMQFVMRMDSVQPATARHVEVIRALRCRGLECGRIDVRQL